MLVEEKPSSSGIGAHGNPRHMNDDHHLQSRFRTLTKVG